MNAPAPQLAVVVVCDRLVTIAKTLGHLRAQTAPELLEVVIVAPFDGELAREDLSREPFGAVQVVEIDQLVSLSWARAAGVRAARAPLVAFVESHSFPEPDWAVALVDAHAGPWAAVGPALLNANPTRSLSWANLLLDYGPWLEPSEGRELDDLPGHNSSYKRDVLLGFGDELDRLLEAESFLHEALRSEGHRLWLEPQARLEHVNVTLVSACLPERLAAGQRFAGARAHGWSLARRVLYVFASPLIPMIRMTRVLPDWRRCRRTQGLPALTLPVSAVLLIVSAAGEMLGYATGSGDSMERLSRIELNKERFVTPAERQALSP